MSSNRSSNASAGHHRGRSSAALFVMIDVRTPASRSCTTASTTGSLMIHCAVVGPVGAVAFRVMPFSSRSDWIAGHASAIDSSPRSMRCHGWSPSPSGPMSRAMTRAGSPSKCWIASRGDPDAMTTPPRSKKAASRFAMAPKCGVPGPVSPARPVRLLRHGCPRQAPPRRRGQEAEGSGVARARCQRARTRAASAQRRRSPRQDRRVPSAPGGTARISTTC